MNCQKSNIDNDRIEDCISAIDKLKSSISNIESNDRIEDCISAIDKLKSSI